MFVGLFAPSLLEINEEGKNTHNMRKPGTVGSGRLANAAVKRATRKPPHKPSVRHKPQIPTGEEVKLRKEFNLPSCEDFRRRLEENTEMTKQMKLDALAWSSDK